MCLNIVKSDVYIATEPIRTLPHHIATSKTLTKYAINSIQTITVIILN